ncbi:MAG: glycosyltransferase [Flavobacteriales bacterium]|nr:glycosyltransferase [Flavobacteriales bacterium]
MPRVLRIINRFNLGGPTHNVAYLSKYLAPEFETMLVGGKWGENEEGSQHILDNLGLEPTFLPEMQREVAPWRDRAAYRRIKQLIQEFKPDIVHTHAAKAGAVGRMAAADMGYRLSYTPFMVTSSTATSERCARSCTRALNDTSRAAARASWPSASARRMNW